MGYQKSIEKGGRLRGYDFERGKEPKNSKFLQTSLKVWPFGHFETFKSTFRMAQLIVGGAAINRF